MQANGIRVMIIKTKEQYEIFKKYLQNVNDAQALIIDLENSDKLSDLDNISLFYAISVVRIEAESLRRSLTYAIEKWEHQQSLQPMK